MKSAEESSLLDQLKEVFRQKFRHCQRLEVVGILSYTVDNSNEKFLKLDFSTSKGQGLLEARGDIHIACCSSWNSDGSVRDISQGLEALRDPSEFKESCSPADASPPLLPPLVIQNARVPRTSGICSTTNVNDSMCTLDSAESPKDVVDGPLHRRDRRKSRRPKRQIVDPGNRGAESETEDGGTEQDEVVSSSDPDILKSRKIPRLACTSDVSCPPVLNVPSQSYVGVRTVQDNSVVVTDFSKQFIDQSRVLNSESVSPNPQSSLNKSTELCCRGPEIQPQTTATAKYTIATKTLGLGELGEFCGLLPLNNILGRTILSCHDNNSLTVKVAPPNTNAPNPVIIPIPESTPQLQQNHGVIPATSHTSSPNVMLNPNLAAAVAAALSAPSQTHASNVTYSDQHNMVGLPSFTGPSIALTGPSGEIIGTIPIGSTGQQHGLLPSVLGTALAPHSTNAVSGVNTVSVSVPLSSCASANSSLANTLNWLRCATASAEMNHQNTQTTQTSVATNSHIQAPNNSIALLQSLTGQNSLHQLSSTPGKVSSISVGPTLALIGTLGLNPVTPTSSTLSTNNENMPSTSSGATSATLLTTNLGLGATNNNNSNNAALVAAALLRGLTGAKGAATEVSEPTCLDTSVGGIPGSVTLIPGGPLSSGAVTTGRPGIVASESTLASLSSILSSKATNSPCATPTTIPFSVYESPVCTASNFNRVGQNTPMLNGVNNAVARGSIMFSCPRGQGEMNVLLAPASAQSLNASSLSSMTAIPTAISFQNILNPQPTSVTLTSPVLLQTQLNNAGGSKPTTTVCTTSTVSSTLSVSPSVLPPIRSKNNPPENKPLQDPTASAIDRILQTIKGCMNNENRDSESKQKLSSSITKKGEHMDSNCVAAATRSNFEDTSGELASCGESKQSYSLKLVPASVPVVKSTGGGTQSDQSTKVNDGSKATGTTGERASLVPIAKDPNDRETPTYRVTKVYRCRYCGKTFNRKFCRERHERLHTGVKPYTCEICEEKFIRLEDKKRHVRSLQHYLAGRGSFLKTESGDGTGEDGTTLGIDPSSVLPLLTQTLQSGDQEAVNGNLMELEETAGLSASDDTSNDQASDCESLDAEDSPGKLANQYLPSNQPNVRINTPDDSSDAPEMRHTPVSCGEDEATNTIPGTDVPPCLVLSTEASVLEKEDDSLAGSIPTSANVVVLINGDNLQQPVPST